LIIQMKRQLVDPCFQTLLRVRKVQSAIELDSTKTKKIMKKTQKKVKVKESSSLLVRIWLTVHSSLRTRKFKFIIFWRQRVEIQISSIRIHSSKVLLSTIKNSHCHLISSKVTIRL
jgi:hypothetical protein